SGRAGATEAQRPAQASQAPAGNSAPKPASDSTGSSGAVLPAATTPEGTRVQRSARISLQVPNGRFDSALDEVIAVADAAGGYISGQEAQATDQGERLRSGQVTFQVPADRFEKVVGDIRRKGSAQSISISGNDVSQQYVDLQARLRNAEAQRNA